MKKLLLDLLQTPSGKFSRKSFIILVTFIFTLLLGGFVAYDQTPNGEGKAVFDSLLLFLSAMVGGTIFDKKFQSKEPQVKNEEDL